MPNQTRQTNRTSETRPNSISLTIVGGSHEHGGADLGPTRAKQAQLQLGVDGKGIADEAPAADAPSDHVSCLTNDMADRVQGFAPAWHFSERKTRCTGRSVTPSLHRSQRPSVD